LKPIPIHAFNPGPYTGAGNWTYLIRGRVTTLIDAGTGEPRHLEALEQALDGATLSQVIVTHGHTDHASGVTALAAKFPGVRFLKMPWPERDGRWPAPWEPLSDGETVSAGDETLTAVHTPGHAPDHLCFWHAESRTMFCGDLAQKGATIYIPPNLQGDLVSYLESLERVLALRPAQLLPAHGPIIDDPASLLRNYIEHRYEREEQILALLREGESTPDAMVRRMYRGLKETLVPMARESVLAHLLKLEGEGRVRRGAASAPLAVADRSAPTGDAARAEHASERGEQAWHIIDP
jgi:glyoxylase-like metal-dependent hydrolase (beta-lactamase superfamily II)